jgi:hypothetical protein
MLIMGGLLSFILGMFFGAGLVAAGEQIAVDTIVKCVKDPDVCGMDSDDLDPSERLEQVKLRVIRHHGTRI